MTGDPPRIEFQDDGEFLDLMVVASNNPPSMLDVRLDESRRKALIEFDYLDEGQGMVVQIVSTSRERVVIRGSVKGARRIRRWSVIMPELVFVPSGVSRRLSGAARRRVIMTGAAVIFSGGLAFNTWVLLQGSADLFSQFLAGVYGLFGVLVAIVLAASSFVSTAPPAGLEAFKELGIHDAPTPPPSPPVQGVKPPDSAGP